MCSFFFISTLLPLLNASNLPSNLLSDIPLCYLTVKDTASNSNKTRDKITILYILIVRFVIVDRVITLPVSFFVQTGGYSNFSKWKQFMTFQQPTMIKQLYMFLYINQFSDWGFQSLLVWRATYEYVTAESTGCIVKLTACRCLHLT
jgi:hypothetical protein